MTKVIIIFNDNNALMIDWLVRHAEYMEADKVEVVDS